MHAEYLLTSITVSSRIANRVGLMRRDVFNCSPGRVARAGCLVPCAVSRLTPPAAKTQVRIKTAAEVRHSFGFLHQYSLQCVIKTKKLRMVAAAFIRSSRGILADSSIFISSFVHKGKALSMILILKCPMTVQINNSIIQLC